MGSFTNDIEPTGGLKTERVITVPITVKYGDLVDLQRIVEDELPNDVSANVKRATSSSETADVVITQTGFGVDPESILRVLDSSGIRFVVGRVRSRKAGDAATDED